MGKKWKIFTVEMQKKILKESEASDCILDELAARYGIRKQRIYNWKTRYKKKSNGFVEAKLTPETISTSSVNAVPNSLKKASFEFAEFTISIEGNFDGSKLEQIIQVGS